MVPVGLLCLVFGYCPKFSFFFYMKEIKICEFQVDVGLRACCWSHCSRNIFISFINNG